METNTRTCEDRISKDGHKLVERGYHLSCLAKVLSDRLSSACLEDATDIAHAYHALQESIGFLADDLYEIW